MSYIRRNSFEIEINYVQGSLCSNTFYNNLNQNLGHISAFYECFDRHRIDVFHIGLGMALI